MKTLWDFRYSDFGGSLRSSSIRELLSFTNVPDMISFAGGLPAPDIFPIRRIEEACISILENNGAQVLQYGSTEGYLPLREMLVRHVARYGIGISPSDILITTGSQQAYDLIGRLFINRGDLILMGTPSYLGVIQAWNALGAKFVSVPMDENGLIVNELEEALRAGPKFIYTQPNFHNPSGATLSLKRRQEIIELADRYGVPMIEDDPYAQLRYDGENLPSLMVLDGMFRDSFNQISGNVIYISSFSKILVPGFRLAWVIAPEDIIRRLTLAKQGTDLQSATFTQAVCYEVAKGGFIDEHVTVIRSIYNERRDVMLETMDETFPSEVQWTRPQGGMFLWGILPQDIDAGQVLINAIEKKVAFVPGIAFHPTGGGENTFRLNFSSSSPEIIREGITRLGRILKEMLIMK